MVFRREPEWQCSKEPGILWRHERGWAVEDRRRGQNAEQRGVSEPRRWPSYQWSQAGTPA
eukprot:4230157-Heterocapsa_arctica.AAC.1